MWIYPWSTWGNATGLTKPKTRTIHPQRWMTQCNGINMGFVMRFFMVWTVPCLDDSVLNSFCIFVDFTQDLYLIPSLFPKNINVLSKVFALLELDSLQFHTHFRFQFHPHPDPNNICWKKHQQSNQKNISKIQFMPRQLIKVKQNHCEMSAMFVSHSKNIR